LLERRFRDQRLMELIYRIINSYRGDLGVGLPIGSLTSQHFANLYLGVFDRYAKEVLRYRGYVRYMDDVVLWGHSREELEKARASCNEFVRDELALEFKPAEPRRVRDGLPFLGCRVFSTHLELNARSKRRWRRRVRVLERSGRLGLMSDRELQQRLTSLTAFASAAGTRSWRFRQTVLQTRTVDSPERLGPGHPWRQLREPCGQLPAGESQQECPVEPR
jgi:hypothetical protein